MVNSPNPGRSFQVYWPRLHPHGWRSCSSRPDGRSVARVAARSDRAWDVVHLLASSFDAFPGAPDAMTLTNKYVSATLHDAFPYDGIGMAFDTGYAFYDVMPNYIQAPISGLIGGGFNLLLTKLFANRAPLTRHMSISRTTPESQGLFIVNHGKPLKQLPRNYKTKAFVLCHITRDLLMK